jgi:serine/threonine-protein kinase
LLGVEALHQAVMPETGEPLGVVHRDLSPRNVMLRQNGEPCIIDLGIGRSNAQDWATRTGVVLGSMGYMSPEQARGAVPDARSDLYAVALILFELLTLEPFIPRYPGRPVSLSEMAHPLFRPVSSFRTDVPQELQTVLSRGLAVSPGARYPTARAFRRALQAISPAQKSLDFIGNMLSALFAGEKTSPRANALEPWTDPRRMMVDTSPWGSPIFGADEPLVLPIAPPLDLPNSSGTIPRAVMPQVVSAGSSSDPAILRPFAPPIEPRATSSTGGTSGGTLILTQVKTESTSYGFAPTKVILEKGKGNS